MWGAWSCCLKVNDELMTGVSHFRAVTTIRRAKGLVQLVVSRPPEHHPGLYSSTYLPTHSDKCNGNAGAQKAELGENPASNPKLDG